MTDSIDQIAEVVSIKDDASPQSEKSVEDEAASEKTNEIVSPTNGTEEAEELTAWMFSKAVSQKLEETNVNLGEIDDVYGLYAIGDAASEAYGGVPGSILKEAVLIILKQLIRKLENGWMRNHLLHLETLWKVEIDKDKTTKRNTLVTMETKPLHPFHENRKRRRQKKVNPLAQSIMGVSSILAQARSKLALPNGNEHDIVETASGEIELDGEPLSFESWGRLNTDSADNVIALAPKRRIYDNRVQLKPNIIEYVTPPPTEVVPTPQPPVAEEPVKPKKSKRPKPKPKRTRRVSEEGELSSSSESDSATSDSDDDDDDFGKPSKSRRTHRAQQRANVANTGGGALKQCFQTLFVQRFDMACHMTVNQKNELLQSLRMVYGTHDVVMKGQEKIASFLSK